MVVGKQHWHFTVDDVRQMVQSGVLPEDARVELINGELLAMAGANGPHIFTVNVLNEQLLTHPGRHWVVSVQNAVQLSTDGQPLPDIALLRRRPPSTSIPTEDDVYLLIEVADTTLRHDRTVKLPLYAAAGIEEVWIVDINGQRVERYTEPRDGGYQIVAQAGRGESLPSLILPEIVIAVDAIFA